MDFFAQLMPPSVLAARNGIELSLSSPAAMQMAVPPVPVQLVLLKLPFVGGVLVMVFWAQVSPESLVVASSHGTDAAAPLSELSPPAAQMPVVLLPTHETARNVLVAGSADE